MFVHDFQYPLFAFIYIPRTNYFMRTLINAHIYGGGRILGSMWHWEYTLQAIFSMHISLILTAFAMRMTEFSWIESVAFGML